MNKTEKKKNLRKGKMLKQIKRNVKGITLIALVVTIIVLLILAGVAINLSIGENGIIARTLEARKVTEQSTAKEQIETILADIQIKFISQSTDFTYEILNNELNKNNMKIISNKNDLESEIDDSLLSEKILDKNDYKVIYISNSKDVFYIELFSDNNSKIRVGDIGVVGERLADVVTKENYGDKVEYSVNGINDWKIFYNDGDNIFLISSNYVPIDNINQDLTGISKYNEYVGFWQDEDSLKANGNSDISNMVINKMQFQWGKEYKYNTTYQAKVASVLLNNNSWNNFCDNKYSIFAVGSPTIELWINAWNELYPDNLLYAKYYSENGGYYVGTTSDPKSSVVTLQEMQNSEGYTNKLFYPNTSGESEVYAYWLATPSVYGNKLIMYDSAIYQDIYTGKVSGFRPVICLKSSIKGESIINNGIKNWKLK